jgi:hypothetical protein
LTSFYHQHITHVLEKFVIALLSFREAFKARPDRLNDFPVVWLFSVAKFDQVCMVSSQYLLYPPLACRRRHFKLLRDDLLNVSEKSTRPQKEADTKYGFAFLDSPSSPFSVGKPSENV